MDENQVIPVYRMSLERLEAFMVYTLSSMSAEELCEAAEDILSVENCVVDDEGIVSFEHDEYSLIDEIDEFDYDEDNFNHASSDTCLCPACSQELKDDNDFANNS